MNLFIKKKVKDSPEYSVLSMMEESSEDKKPLDIEIVVEILHKPSKERTRKDYERVHSFMIDNIMFFKPKTQGE